MSYEYDFFISYRRDPPVGPWVRNHFAPLLELWLNESCSRPVSMYVDVDDVAPGEEWPLNLRRALSRSCFLIPVFSPSYFRARWCLAELSTLQERERALGLRTDANPGELIFPVKFNDGSHFADSVKTIQTTDLSPWNQPWEAYAQTPAYIDLSQAVAAFAAKLAEKIDTAPDWDPDWPMRMPRVHTSYDIALPRLGTT